MIRLIIISCVTVIVVLGSSYGWRFWVRSYIPQKEDDQLSKQLLGHVYVLAHQIGDRSVYRYQKMQEAAAYISERLESFGLEVKYQEYDVWGKTVRNIIATKKGTTHPQEVIIVGAHYDTCSNPGADDNASGIAGLLECARYLSDQELQRSVRFVAFANEEPPFFRTELMGSTVYARRAKETGAEIRGVVVLEMIGYYSSRWFSQKYPPFLGCLYPNRGNFVAIVGNWASRRLVSEFQGSFRRHSSFPIYRLIASGIVPGVDFSDHWSFWQQGYPALMVTDTSFYRYPDYHGDADTYEKLDYHSMAGVVRGVRGAIVELAGLARNRG